MPAVTVMVKPVSGACNMRCKYCFYADEMARRGQGIYPAMDAEMLETLVRRVMVYADGQATFTFQGGEPTLAGVDFFRRLLKLQAQYNNRGIRVQNAVQTNGLELSDELIALFAENRFLIGVSLDGCEAAHDHLRRDAKGEGTFRRVRNNVLRLLRAGVDTNILCVVNGEVAARADAVLDALQGFEYLQFIPCMDGMDGTPGPSPLTDEAYGAFLQAAFERYERAFYRGEMLSIRNFDNLLGMLLGMPPENCAMRGVCSVNFLVESTGDVYPCDFYALDEWKLGNLREKSLRQMARGDVGQQFFETSLPVPDACRACPVYPLCRNGCRRERDAKTGLYRFCRSTRTFLENNRDRMEKMARILQSRR